MWGADIQPARFLQGFGVFSTGFPDGKPIVIVTDSIGKALPTHRDWILHTHLAEKYSKMLRKKMYLAKYA